MRGLCVLLIVILIVAIFPVSAVAQAATEDKTKPAVTEPPKHEEAKAMAKAPEMMFKGEVISTDTTEKTIVVKGKDKQMTFIAMDKVTPMLTELVAGDHVKVRYSEMNGKYMAHRVMKQKMKIEKK